MAIKIFLSAALVLAGLIFPAAAAAQEVKLSRAEGVDYSKYKTYKWQRAEKAKYPDPGTDQIMMRAIDEQLAAKGLVKSQTESADLYVIYQLAISEDVAWSSFTSDIGWTGNYAAVPFAGATTNSTSVIRTGWLILDLYDVAQKKLVWQIYASKTLGKGTDPKKVEKNARKAMTKIFKYYPPQ